MDNKENIFMGEFIIYFSDLNERAKKEFLEAMGVSSEKELNMDVDNIPLAIFEMEDEYDE